MGAGGGDSGGGGGYSPPGSIRRRRSGGGGGGSGERESEDPRDKVARELGRLRGMGRAGDDEAGAKYLAMLKAYGKELGTARLKSFGIPESEAEKVDKWYSEDTGGGWKESGLGFLGKAIEVASRPQQRILQTVQRVNRAADFAIGRVFYDEPSENFRGGEGINPLTPWVSTRKADGGRGLPGLAGLFGSGGLEEKPISYHNAMLQENPTSLGGKGVEAAGMIATDPLNFVSFGQGQVARTGVRQLATAGMRQEAEAIATGAGKTLFTDAAKRAAMKRALMEQARSGTAQVPRRLLPGTKTVPLEHGSLVRPLVGAADLSRGGGILTRAGERIAATAGRRPVRRGAELYAERTLAQMERRGAGGLVLAGRTVGKGSRWTTGNRALSRALEAGHLPGWTDKTKLLTGTAANGVLKLQHLGDAFVEGNFGRPLRFVDPDKTVADPAVGRAAANAYDVMEHAPDDPRVAASYAALREAIEGDAEVLHANGYQFHVADTIGEGVSGSEKAADVIEEVAKTNRIRIRPTQSSDLENFLPGHPMLAPLDPALAKRLGLPEGTIFNDLFRAVHDLRGHAMIGNDFGRHGEEAAFAMHSQMVPEEALGALATETRGQNSWLNFSRANEGKGVGDATKAFPTQKAGLLPEEFWRPADDLRQTIPGAGAPAEGRTRVFRNVGREGQDPEGTWATTSRERAAEHMGDRTLVADLSEAELTEGQKAAVRFHWDRNEDMLRRQGYESFDDWAMDPDVNHGTDALLPRGTRFAEDMEGVPTGPAGAREAARKAVLDKEIERVQRALAPAQKRLEKAKTRALSTEDELADLTADMSAVLDAAPGTPTFGLGEKIGKARQKAREASQAADRAEQVARQMDQEYRTLDQQAAHATGQARERAADVQDAAFPQAAGGEGRRPTFGTGRKLGQEETAAGTLEKEKARALRRAAIAREATERARAEAAKTDEGLNKLYERLDGVTGSRAQEGAEAAPGAPGPRSGASTPPAEGTTRYFHGTSRRMVGDAPVEGAGNVSENLYGPGLYVTDDAAVAGSYTRKGRGAEPTVYEVDVPNDTRFLDLDAPLPDDARAQLRAWVDEAPLPEELDPAELATLAESGSGRQFYDALREGLADAGARRAEADELFDGLNHRLRQSGYGGLAHKGGARTGGAEHGVRILFDPASATTRRAAEEAPAVARRTADAAPAKPTYGMGKRMQRAEAQAREAAKELREAQANFDKLASRVRAEGPERLAKATAAGERASRTADWESRPRLIDAETRASASGAEPFFRTVVEKQGIKSRLAETTAGESIRGMFVPRAPTISAEGLGKRVAEEVHDVTGQAAASKYHQPLRTELDRFRFLITKGKLKEHELPTIYAALETAGGIDALRQSGARDQVVQAAVGIRTAMNRMRRSIVESGSVDESILRDAETYMWRQLTTAGEEALGKAGGEQVVARFMREKGLQSTLGQGGALKRRQIMPEAGIAEAEEVIGGALRAKGTLKPGERLYEEDPFKSAALRLSAGYAAAAEAHVLTGLGQVLDDTGNAIVLTARRSDNAGVLKTMEHEANRLGYLPVTLSSDANLVAYVHPEVLPEVERLRAVIFNDTAIKNWEKFLDYVTGIWKRGATIPATAGVGFVSRNVIGNIFNNFVRGVSNPALYAEAWGVQRLIAKTALRARETGEDFDTALLALRDAGKVRGEGLAIGRRSANVTDRRWQLIQEARTHGILDEGFYTVDLGEGELRRLATSRAGRVRQGANPFSRESVIYRPLSWLNGAAEQNGRMAHFIDKIDKLGNPVDAARSVKETLFDYSDLTAFERIKLKRVNAFYTFTRKNLAFQAHMAKEAPARIRRPLLVEEALFGNADRPGSREEGSPLLPSYALDQGQRPLSANIARLLTGNKRASATGGLDFPIYNALDTISPIIEMGAIGVEETPLLGKLVPAEGLQPRGGNWSQRASQVAREGLGLTSGTPAEVLRLWYETAGEFDSFTGAPFVSQSGSMQVGKMDRFLAMTELLSPGITKSLNFGRMATGAGKFRNRDYASWRIAIARGVIGASITPVDEKASNAEAWGTYERVNRELREKYGDDLPTWDQLQKDGFVNDRTPSRTQGRRRLVPAGGGSSGGGGGLPGI